LRLQNELSHRNLLNRLRAFDAMTTLFSSDPSNRYQVATFGIRDALRGDSFKPFRVALYVALTDASTRLPVYPHWFSLLSTKFGMIIRRRYPVLLLTPLLTSSDQTIRHATCHTLKRACILAGVGTIAGLGGGATGRLVLHHDLVSQLLAELPVMMQSTSTSIESGYYLMHLLVPFKIKGVNAYFATKFLPGAVSILEKSTTSNGIRLSSLLLIESLLMTRPKSCRSLLEPLRDRLRELLCYTTGALQSLISRVYCLLCHVASNDPILGPTASSRYVHYLRNDLCNDDWQRQSDPLLNRLNSAQLKMVTLTTISAMGCLRGSSTASTIIDELIPFLHHSDAMYRLHALEAINQQMTFLGPIASSFARWGSVPLMADADLSVRLQFDYGAMATNRTPILMYRSALLSAEIDDNYPPSVMGPAEAAMERDNADVREYIASDLITPPAKVAPSPSPPTVPSDDNEFKTETFDVADDDDDTIRPPSLASSIDITLERNQVLTEPLARELTSSIDTVHPTYLRSPEWTTDASIANSRAYPKPSINNNLSNSVKRLVRRHIGTPPPSPRFDELVYHLQSSFSLPLVGGCAAIVMSELCRLAAARILELDSLKKATTASALPSVSGQPSSAPSIEGKESPPPISTSSDGEVTQAQIESILHLLLLQLDEHVTSNVPLFNFVFHFSCSSHSLECRFSK
jgi:hypothetical protein